MTADELRTYMAGRPASPNVARKDMSALTCYGCAHASASAPPPGKPSGERPCCACVRNPERIQQSRQRDPLPIVVDDRGNARCFDPFAGTAYNGVPYRYHPSDRYRTLDSSDMDDWLDDHPEYQGAVRGGPVIESMMRAVVDDTP